MHARHPVIILASIVIALGAALALALYWLKRPYGAPDQVRFADEFVQMLGYGRFEVAYDLTFKNKLVGTTLPEFEIFARRQLCGTLSKTEVFPPQTNGNRLRLLLSGADVEMPEVGVQYEGACFFKVTLRRSPGGTWKVFNFGSHAG